MCRKMCISDKLTVGERKGRTGGGGEVGSEGVWSRRKY